jgi:hypothetical protein
VAERATLGRYHVTTTFMAALAFLLVCFELPVCMLAFSSCSLGACVARLPLYCSAECATPTNSSLFAKLSRNLANALLPRSLLNHSALALFAQRTRIPTSARSRRVAVNRKALPSKIQTITCNWAACSLAAPPYHRAEQFPL